MKKIIRLTEQDLVKLVKKVVKEQSSLNKKPSNFKAYAHVEGDMVMEFPVVSFTDGNRYGEGIVMNIIHPVNNKELYVKNFEGPIYDFTTKKMVYTSSDFSNINVKNYKQIAQSQNIPVSVMTT
jgi:hypothetical protein